MRKLASVRTISEIKPIEGADLIEVVKVDNWKVVAQKGEFKVGDKVVYFEIDSFLPIREEFEFLRKSSYRKLADESEGFRLRTIRLRGQVSQGLVMPLDIIYSERIVFEKNTVLFEPKNGDDVTELLDVVKFDPPLPAELAGDAVGNFPSFIVKTDEERIQNLTDEYENYKKFKFFASEKMDGSSSTFFLNEGEFGVCTRNYQMKINPDNTFGRILSATNLEDKLRAFGRNLAIQGEIVGEGVQDNKYKLKGQKLLVYNIFDIDIFDYVSKEEMLKICNEFGLETVPTILVDFTLPETIEELLEIANGKSVLNANTIREGLVWVSIDSPVRISFKTISNTFLLKYDE
jgi:RNA ligase (TIGR02306 family)